MICLMKPVNQVALTLNNFIALVLCDFYYFQINHVNVIKIGDEILIYVDHNLKILVFGRRYLHIKCIRNILFVKLKFFLLLILKTNTVIFRSHKVVTARLFIDMV